MKILIFAIGCTALILIGTKAKEPQMDQTGPKTIVRYKAPVIDVKALQKSIDSEVNVLKTENENTKKVCKNLKKKVVILNKNIETLNAAFDSLVVND